MLTADSVVVIVGLIDLMFDLLMYDQIVFGLKDQITSLDITLVAVGVVDDPMSLHLVLGVGLVVALVTHVDRYLMFVGQVVQQLLVGVELLLTELTDKRPTVLVVAVHVHLERHLLLEGEVTLRALDPIGQVM